MLQELTIKNALRHLTDTILKLDSWLPGTGFFSIETHSLLR